MFLRYYWTIAIYFQSNTYYFLSSTVLLHFVFPPFSPSWKKGINDERRLGSHQFSSSTCKEASQYFALLFSSAHSAAEPENGDLILDCSERWMSFVSQQGDDALVTHTHLNRYSKQARLVIVSENTTWSIFCLELEALSLFFSKQSSRFSYPFDLDWGGSGLGLLWLGISLDLGGGANFLWSALGPA